MVSAAIDTISTSGTLPFDVGESFRVLPGTLRETHCLAERSSKRHEHR